MFDLDRWRQEVHQRLRPFLQRPRQEPYLAGCSSLFTYLATKAIEPFIEAYISDPMHATIALSNVDQGQGANYLVRHAMQLRYQAPLLLRRELQHSPQLRALTEQLLIQLGVIDLIRSGLDDTQGEWFRLALRHEIETWTMSGELRVLRDMIQSPTWQSRYAVIQQLQPKTGRYSVDDQALLVTSLNDSSNHVRAAAARRLGLLRSAIDEDVRHGLLQTALHDRDLGARYAAARALGALRDYLPMDLMLELLTTALYDDDSFVRSAAALVLGQFGERAATSVVIESLLRLLKDRDSYTREASAQALGMLGRAAATEEVMSGLAETLLDTDFYVHEAALTALGGLRELRSRNGQPHPVPS